MNLVDLNLDVMNLVQDIPDDWVVFYFLSGPDETEEDFLYAKGDTEAMSETLAALMQRSEQIEQIVRDAITIFME